MVPFMDQTESFYITLVSVIHTSIRGNKFYQIHFSKILGLENCGE